MKTDEQLVDYLKEEYLSTAHAFGVADKIKQIIAQKNAEIERLKLMNYEVSSGNYDTHIFELKQKLALAVEALKFYADVESWQLRTFNEADVTKGYAVRISNHDAEYLEPANRYFGGKRARQCLKEVEDMNG